jgi:hypothetical protein
MEGMTIKLPHGVVTVEHHDDPCYPGVQILLDGVCVLWIEEVVPQEGIEDRSLIQTHTYTMRDDEPVHTEVLKTF